VGKFIKEIKEFEEFLKEQRENRKKVVFTNGCFDIIHAGHVDYLEKAKSFGDILIIGVNSDSSIKRIKGENRPIVSQKFRIRALLGLKVVDAVVLFDEDTPLNLIRLVKPDVLVKGADWPVEKIIGREYADKVERIDFVYEISTSKIIERIVETYCGDIKS